MTTLLVSLLMLVNNVLGAYILVLVGRVILSWLISFGILNGGHAFVALVDSAAGAVVDPILNLLKKYLPFLVVKSLDFSPLVLYFLVQVLQIGLISLAVSIAA